MVNSHADEIVPPSWHDKIEQDEAEWIGFDSSMHELHAELGWLSRCARFVVAMQNQLLQSGSPPVPVSVLCRLFGVARSITYYQPRGRHR